MQTPATSKIIFLVQTRPRQITRNICRALHVLLRFVNYGSGVIFVLLPD